VLYTGRPAFTAGFGAASLFKLTEGGQAAERVPVELGRTSVNLVEIVRGLDVGDRIITSDMSQYVNATKVRIR
jgi:HlyD family secretion protein